MKTYLDNLRPFEKRLVVGVGVMLFVVFNLWFVVPHFSDWESVQSRMSKTREKLENYTKEVDEFPSVKRQVEKLEGESYKVPEEEQSTHFAGTVQEKAAQSAVNLNYSSPVHSRTNMQFFLELSQTIAIQSKEQQLVDFLVSLGSGDSMIRVRDLGLKTDAPRQNLVSNIKVVANYQKKMPARAGATGTRTATQSSAPASRPALPTARPPTSNK
jgi:hypothetical protein